MVLQCLLVSGRRASLTEISADIREAVVHYRRVHDNARYKSLFTLLHRHICLFIILFALSVSPSYYWPCSCTDSFTLVLGITEMLFRFIWVQLLLLICRYLVYLDFTITAVFVFYSIVLYGIYSFAVMYCP